MRKNNMEFGSLQHQVFSLWHQMGSRNPSPQSGVRWRMPGNNYTTSCVQMSPPQPKKIGGNWVPKFKLCTPYQHA